MSDRALAEAKSQAAAEPTLENLLQVEAMLDRAGQKAEETYYAILDAYVIEMEAATKLKTSLIEIRSAEAKIEYVAQHGSSLKCPSCKGSGWIRSYDTDYPCGCVSEKTFQPDFFKLRDIRHSIEVPGLQDTIDCYETLRTEYQNRLRWTEIGVGALVQYNNPRARAKYKETRDKVEIYELGIVTWLGDPTAYRSRYGSWSQGESQSVEVNTFDGNYRTYVKNLEPKVFNAWSRFRGYDAEGQRQASNHQQCLDDVADLKQRFGRRSLERRQRVVLNGVEGMIFWVGLERKTGRQRIGFKAGLNPTRSDEAIWALAVDCERSSRYGN